ncbi:MAG TPA: exodeoxyribonuclease VII large subunit, partial [Moraxellaceae bacterium]
LQVLVYGETDLYEARGQYQFIVRVVIDHGAGKRQQEFERLKKQLADEGLFAPEKKRPLPLLPRTVGFITSPTGAAVRDILSVLGRRFRGLPVTVIPVPVQGKEAGPAIVRALALANAQPDFDIILVARGGGSLEDLWAFNEEIVARAIAGSRLPVVSGVGHETDFTIADFVADVRAPTPSAAAELLSQDGEGLLDSFEGFEILLTRALRKQLGLLSQQVTHLRARLRHPGQRLQELMQRLDGLELRLKRAQTQELRSRAVRLDNLLARLRVQHPAQRLPALQQQLATLEQRLSRSMNATLREQKTTLQHLAERAQLASPLAIVARGYAIVESEGRVLRSIDDAEVGQTLSARLADGQLTATITAKEKT